MSKIEESKEYILLQEEFNKLKEENEHLKQKDDDTSSIGSFNITNPIDGNLLKIKRDRQSKIHSNPLTDEVLVINDKYMSLEKYGKHHIIYQETKLTDLKPIPYSSEYRANWNENFVNELKAINSLYGDILFMDERKIHDYIHSIIMDMIQTETATEMETLQKKYFKFQTDQLTEMTSKQRYYLSVSKFYNDQNIILLNDLTVDNKIFTFHEATVKDFYQKIPNKKYLEIRTLIYHVQVQVGNIILKSLYKHAVLLQYVKEKAESSHVKTNSQHYDCYYYWLYLCAHEGLRHPNLNAKNNNKRVNLIQYKQKLQSHWAHEFFRANDTVDSYYNRLVKLREDQEGFDIEISNEILAQKLLSNLPIVFDRVTDLFFVNKEIPAPQDVVDMLANFELRQKEKSGLSKMEYKINPNILKSTLMY
jgi:hypothetical protein